MMVQLPEDKLVRYRSDVQAALKVNKMFLRDLQSLIGKLQFATTVVKVGKAFLRRLYDLTVGATRPFDKVDIRPGKADLRMWVTFSNQYNGMSFITEPSIVESKLYQPVFRCFYPWVWWNLWVLLGTGGLAGQLESQEYSFLGVISHPPFVTTIWQQDGQLQDSTAL